MESNCSQWHDLADELARRTMTMLDILEIIGNGPADNDLSERAGDVRLYMEGAEIPIYIPTQIRKLEERESIRERWDTLHNRVNDLARHLEGIERSMVPVR